MESLFKFKKPSKKMVGEFDTNDGQEWCLLHKPQIGNVTMFIHFHKLWLIQEIPEIVADESLGIEGKPGILRKPALEIFTGFVKEGKFVVEKQKIMTERIDDLANQRFLKNLELYLDEYGYNKDWDNYIKDQPVVPNYYEQPKGTKTTKSLGNLQNTFTQMMKATTGQVVPSQQNP